MSRIYPSEGRADNICLSDIRYQRLQTDEMTDFQSRFPFLFTPPCSFPFLFVWLVRVFFTLVCLSSIPICSALIPKQSSSALSKTNLLFNALWEGMHGRKEEGKTMVSVTTGVFRSVFYLGMGGRGLRDLYRTVLCQMLFVRLLMVQWTQWVWSIRGSGVQSSHSHTFWAVGITQQNKWNQLSPYLSVRGKKKKILGNIEFSKQQVH